MAPSIHPPCTPSSSCTPIRCHPLLPPCQNPDKCMRTTLSKNIRPCQSALSILSTRSKARCTTCSKKPCASNPRSKSRVRQYLRRKSRENRMRRKDMLTGSHTYLSYVRRKGSVKSARSCCAGKGHRGRLKERCCVRCCRRFKRCCQCENCCRCEIL